MTAPLRVLLDVNVWVANLLSTARGRRGTAVQKIVAMIAVGRWGDEGRAAQLVISHEMLETLEIVLGSRGVAPDDAAAYADAVMGIMQFGPDELDPYLLLGGREQFAMADAEDAGVLATAFASRTDLLVTDNLKDFRTGDAARAETAVVTTSSGPRQLHALRHRHSGRDLIVAHPLDVIAWLERGYDFEPGPLWERVSPAPAGPT